MKLFFYFHLLSLLLGISSSNQIFSWTRRYGGSLSVANEFASVNIAGRTVLHSGLDSAIPGSFVPVISYHDFSVSLEGFQKGITAIRPLIPGGKRLCLLVEESRSWASVTNTLVERAWTEIVKSPNATKFMMRKSLPDQLDLGVLTHITEFCGVEQKSIFYLKKVSGLSNSISKLRVQGLFRRFTIGVPERLQDDVFGLSLKTGKLSVANGRLLVHSKEQFLPPSVEID